MNGEMEKLPENRDDEKSGEVHEVYEFRSFETKRISPLKAKILLWSILVGGIALGTLFFLFFLTLFIYLFLPVLIVISLWSTFRYWKYNRRGPNG